MNRGAHSEIDIFPGTPCDNKLAGNVVDICPVGALCSKDFLYKQRVWFLKSQDSVCPNCSTGCSITVDHHKDIVYRLKPRTNPQAQGDFMCDEGRFGFKYINADERLQCPTVRQENNTIHVPWDAVLPGLRRQLAEAVQREPGSAWMVLSPWLTCEEAYLAAKYFKDLSPQVKLALGPIPVTGEDDLYPKGIHGESPPANKAKFTIRAEKCPNRCGVEAIVQHYQGELIGFERVLTAAKANQIKTLYLLAGYRESWIAAAQAADLQGAEFLVVQDILPSPVSAVAKYVLPGAAFAEKDGTFVSHAGLAQGIRWAVQPPGEARSDGRILMDLMERRGLVHAPTLRAELANEVPFFAALGDGKLSPHGVFLKQ
jgi:NADH-quinone oxidoreductase subunit G